MESFLYAERAPSPAISPWVLALWTFRAERTPAADDPYTVWPDGCTSVGLSRADEGRGPSLLICVGPRVTALQPPVQAARQLWGVRFWPDVAELVLGVPAREMREHVGLAPARVAEFLAGIGDAIPATRGTDVGLAAVDAFLQPRLRGKPQPDPQVRAAVAAIVRARGEIAMPDVAQASGMSLRQLQRRFPEATGLTLREWARVRRLREALAARLTQAPAGWSRIAAEVGFVDHAHLTREFVALTGVRPMDAVRHLARTVHDEVRP